MEGNLSLSKKLREILDFLFAYYITRGTPQDKSLEYIHHFLVNDSLKDSNVFESILEDENKNNYPEYKNMIIRIMITTFYEYMKNIEYAEIKFEYNIKKRFFQDLDEDITAEETIDNFDEEEELDLDEDIITTDITAEEIVDTLENEEILDLFTFRLIKNKEPFDIIYDLFKSDLGFAVNMIDVFFAYDAFEDKERYQIINEIISKEEHSPFDFYNPLHVFEWDELNKKYNNKITYFDDVLTILLEYSMAKNDYNVDNLFNYYQHIDNKKKLLLTKLALIFYKQSVINKEVFRSVPDMELNFVELIENENNDINKIVDIISKNKSLFAHIINYYEWSIGKEYQDKLDAYSKLNELGKNKILKKFNPIYTYDYVVLNIEKGIKENN